MNNNAINNARISKYDEWYTCSDVIERELGHYGNHFANKSIYCNCDDWERSEFVRYFLDNFRLFNLKQVIATSYVPYGRGRWMTFDGSIQSGSLETSGEFDNEYDEKIMTFIKSCDIVITNPPFSLFRAFMDFLIKHGPDFILLAPMGAVTYANVWPLFKAGDIHIGCDVSSKSYMKPDGSIEKLGNTWWLSSLDHGIVKKGVKTVPYDSMKHPKYDNLDAIECSSIASIPDCDDWIGVPVSYLSVHRNDQYEIIGCFMDVLSSQKELGAVKTKCIVNGAPRMSNGPVVNERQLYSRIVIQRIN